MFQMLTTGGCHEQQSPQKKILRSDLKKNKMPKHKHFVQDTGLHEYITKYPKSKVASWYKSTAKLIIDSQVHIPSTLNIYDLECKYEEDMNVWEDGIKKCWTHFQQILVVRFRYNDLYVLCEQNMWFKDKEHSQPTNSDESEQELCISFSSSEREESVEYTTSQERDEADAENLVA
jgi:hypothetical protein